VIPHIEPTAPAQFHAIAANNNNSLVAPAPVEPLSVAAAIAASPLKPNRLLASNGPRFAVIRFKHESCTFLAPFKIAVNDTVVVEGDRGENIGVVSEIMKDAPKFVVTAKILRKALDRDLAQLAAQRERENIAVRATRSMAESLGLAGKVEDAEYQFDMNKLTIFVRRPSKSTFVDFRKLQRGLFREFRCRIWCAYMDEVEASESAPRFK